MTSGMRAAVVLMVLIFVAGLIVGWVGALLAFGHVIVR